MKTTNLEVLGMTCDNCVRHVEKALRGIDGVEAVDVSLVEARATVEHLDSVTTSELVASVEEEGYEARAA